jgi:hypothetical protein
LNSIQSASGHAAGGNDALIDQIIHLEYPLYAVEKAVFDSVKMINKADSSPTPPGIAMAQARREALKALTPEALQAIRSKLLLAKEQREEAKRFYNHPNAKADFKHWLAMDVWTLDQAVALLLGKDPRHVNKGAIDADLAKPSAWLATQKPPTAFTRRYQDLTQRAEGAKAMTAAAKLDKQVVIDWGRTVLGDQMPAELSALLHAVAQPTSATERADDGQAVTIVTVAKLKQLDKQWPTVKTDLERASRNGLSEAAKLPGKNKWWKERALDWADRQGKLKVDKSQGEGSGLSGWARSLGQ